MSPYDRCMAGREQTGEGNCEFAALSPNVQLTTDFN